MLSLSGHDDVALFERRRQWRWINKEIRNYIIIASLKSVQQWVNWLIEYQVRVFWYQVYQARLWERMLNRSTSLAMSTNVLKALPGKLDIKRHSPSILYLMSLRRDKKILFDITRLVEWSEERNLLYHPHHWSFYFETSFQKFHKHVHNDTTLTYQWHHLTTLYVISNSTYVWATPDGLYAGTICTVLSSATTFKTAILAYSIWVSKGFDTGQARIFVVN